MDVSHVPAVHLDGAEPLCAFCSQGDTEQTPVFDFTLVPGLVHRVFTSSNQLPQTDAGLSTHAVFAAPCGLTPPNVHNASLSLETYDFSACSGEGDTPVVCRCNPDKGRACMLAAAENAYPRVNVSHELVSVMLPYKGVELQYAIKSTYTSHVCVEDSTCFTRIWYVCPTGANPTTAVFEQVQDGDLSRVLCPFPEHHDRRDLCLLFYTPAMCFYQPCKDDCSGHGRCINGACVCAPGYDGTYCNQQILCRDVLKARVNRTCASVATCLLRAADMNAADEANSPVPQLDAECSCPRGFSGDGYTCYPHAKRLTDPLGRMDSDSSVLSIVSTCILIGAVMVTGIATSPLFGRARARGHARAPATEGATAHAPVRDAVPSSHRSAGHSRRTTTSMMGMLTGATAASVSVTADYDGGHRTASSQQQQAHSQSAITRILRRDS